MYWPRRRDRATNQVDQATELTPLQQAVAELQAADSVFNEVSDPNVIDQAISQLNNANGKVAEQAGRSGQRRDRVLPWLTRSPGRRDV